MRVQLDVGQSVLLRLGEGETITDRAERTVRLLLDHELIALTWSRYELGERGPAAHVHREHADVWFVLSGELMFELGPEAEKVAAPAGTLVLAPRNLIHSFWNESSETTTFLNIHAPSRGFGAHLHSDDSSWDSFDPPEGGGRPAADTIVSGPEALEPEPYAFAIKAELEELSVPLLAFDAGWEGVDPHVHERLVDAFFVLEGEVEFALGDERVTVGPGTFVAASPGVRHGFGPGLGRSVVLNLHAPDEGFAARLRED